MAKGSLEDRRSGRDRRREDAGTPKHQERRRADRRQFPPVEKPGEVPDATRELQGAIDAYKKRRHLARISADELVSLLERLGYRKA